METYGPYCWSIELSNDGKHWVCGGPWNNLPPKLKGTPEEVDEAFRIFSGSKLIRKIPVGELLEDIDCSSVSHYTWSIESKFLDEIPELYSVKTTEGSWHFFDTETGQIIRSSPPRPRGFFDFFGSCPDEARPRYSDLNEEKTPYIKNLEPLHFGGRSRGYIRAVPTGNSGKGETQLFSAEGTLLATYPFYSSSEDLKAVSLKEGVAIVRRTRGFLGKKPSESDYPIEIYRGGNLVKKISSIEILGDKTEVYSQVNYKRKLLGGLDKYHTYSALRKDFSFSTVASNPKAAPKDLKWIRLLNVEDARGFRRSFNLLDGTEFITPRY